MYHVVIVNCVYPPEPVVSAQIGRDLAVRLSQVGTRVTVLCPYPSRPIGTQYLAFQQLNKLTNSSEDGVTVTRLPSFVSSSSSLISRMTESFSFGQHACRHLEGFLSAVDLVYVNAWPLLSQAMIARCCGRLGVPFVLHVQDIYPESLLSKVPKVFHWIIKSPFVAFDGWISRQAAQVVMISDRTRRAYIVSRRLAPEKVVTIFNWQDEGQFIALPTRTAACEQFSVPKDRFTFLYLGNIGPVAGVHTLIEAFVSARLERAQLLIIGEGSEKAECVRLVKKLGAGNIRFVSVPDVVDVPRVQSIADVLLLPMKRGAGLTSIPSKLPAYLFSAKPILSTVDGKSDTAQCISDANCGWVGQPEDIRWLAFKMREVASMSSSELETLGRNGRRYGHLNFTKSSGVERLTDLILGVATKHRNATLAAKPLSKR